MLKKNLFCVLLLINSCFLKSNFEDNLDFTNQNSFALDFTVNIFIYKLLVAQKIDFIFNKVKSNSNQLENIIVQDLLENNFNKNFNIKLNTLKSYIDSNYSIDLKRLFNIKVISFISLSLLKDMFLSKYNQNQEIYNFKENKIFNLSKKSSLFLISNLAILFLDRFYLLDKILLNNSNLFKFLNQKFKLELPDFILSNYIRFLALTISNIFAIKKFDNLTNENFIKNITKNNDFLKLLKNYNSLNKEQEKEICIAEDEIKNFILTSFNKYTPSLWTKSLFNSKLKSEILFSFIIFTKALFILRNNFSEILNKK